MVGCGRLVCQAVAFCKSGNVMHRCAYAEVDQMKHTMPAASRQFKRRGFIRWPPSVTSECDFSVRRSERHFGVRRRTRLQSSISEWASDWEVRRTLFVSAYQVNEKMFEAILDHARSSRPIAKLTVTRRNLDRFPADFMFQPSESEVVELNLSQIVIGSQKPRDPQNPCLRTRPTLK